MLKYMLLFLLFVLAQQSSFAETDYQLWQAFFQQTRTGNHTGYWIDIHYRTHNQFLQNFSGALFRFGGTYYVKDNIRLTGGYVYMLQFPSLDDQTFYKQEHRPWQLFQYGYSAKRVKLQTALRIEERFIQKSKGTTILPGYEFRNRYRLAATVAVQLNKQKLPIGNVSLILSEEAMVNAYSTDNAKLFDQNRFFSGFGFQITETFQVQMGYMHIYLATAKGYDNVYTARIYFIHTPDFRKKK